MNHCLRMGGSVRMGHARIRPSPVPVVYQVRVVVAGISPLIWRRLLVSAEATIADLHAILQTAFGWSGEHLHHFTVHGAQYGVCYDGGPVFAMTPTGFAWPAWACARVSGSATSTTSSPTGAWICA
jgi:hypothetical protein